MGENPLENGGVQEMVAFWLPAVALRMIVGAPGILGVPGSLRSTDTLLDSSLVTARSGRPSPFRSPTATDVGLEPTAKSVFGHRLPVPSPNSTETVFEFRLATATSR